MIRTIAAALVTSRRDYANSVLYGIPSKYISRFQRNQNTLARVVGGSRTPNRTSNLATLSQRHWLPIHDRIKFKIATRTHKALYTSNPPYLANLVHWHTHAELYDLPLPNFCLLLVVTSHLVLEVFAGIVSLLTSILAKLSQHSTDT